MGCIHSSRLEYVRSTRSTQGCDYIQLTIDSFANVQRVSILNANTRLLQVKSPRISCLSRAMIPLVTPFHTQLFLTFSATPPFTVFPLPTCLLISIVMTMTAVVNLLTLRDWYQAIGSPVMPLTQLPERSNVSLTGSYTIANIVIHQA